MRLQTSYWKNAGTPWYRRKYEGYVDYGHKIEHYKSWTRKGVQNESIRRVHEHVAKTLDIPHL